MSYKKVKQWQATIHPRHPETKEPYHWWDADVKYVPVFAQQIKKKDWITEEARQIGLGAVLYLFTMKALAYLFLLIAIINIPLFMFYVNGQGPVAASRTKSGQFTEVLSRLSVGNLGVSGMTCSNVNLAQNLYNLTFSCDYGTMRQLFQFGMQKIDNQSCTTNGLFIGEGSTADNFQIDCSFDYGLTEQGRADLMQQFDANCFD